ncbi:MAG: DUF502 domain-containing protein [Polyangiales bacterium]
MNKIARSFGQGLLVIAPIAITTAVVWWVVKKLDDLLNAPFPGLGLVMTIIGITAIGYLTRNVVGARIIKGIEKVIQRVPFVYLLYSSLRDLFGAFVGDRRSFDKPVFVEIEPGGPKFFGFLTCDHFDDAQLKDHVAVYLPQSYNFAGNLVVVPRGRVSRVDADGAEFMAFVVSGGVTTMHGARTLLDSRALKG